MKQLDRFFIGLLSVMLIGMLALRLAGCGSTSQPNPIETFLRNVSAQNCANQSALISQIPAGFLTPAQETELVSLVCAGFFGTAPAPTPAPGNLPVFPGASIAPSPAPPVS